MDNDKEEFSNPKILIRRLESRKSEITSGLEITILLELMIKYNSYILISLMIKYN